LLGRKEEYNSTHLHLGHELRVGLHVGAAQPPAAHAIVGGLLKQARRAVVVVHNEQRHLHSAQQLGLQDTEQGSGTDRQGIVDSLNQN
jgi:hypothetical protein